MHCPNCGSVNRDGAKYCDECGLPLGGAIARVTAGIQSSKPLFDDNEDKLKPIQKNESVIEEAESHAPQDSNEQQETALDESEQAEDDKLTNDDEASEESDVSDAAESQEENDVAPAHEEERSEEGVEDLTGLITSPTQDPEITRMYDEDEFAGFNKHSDDGFSFSEPYNYNDGSIDPLSAQNPGFTMKMPRVEGESGEKSRDFVASATVPKKSHAKTIGIIVAVVALVAIAAIATYALGIWGGKVIPDVTNMTETDARAVLEDSGFIVRSEQVKSDDTEGLVLIMDPDAGTRAPDGSEVIIHVASARLIPDVIGKTRDEAAAILAEAGYDNIKYETAKSEGEEGIVLAISPEPGSRSKSSMEIVVTVSEAFRVPDVSGMYWNDAFQAVEDAGFVPQVVYVNTEYYAEGTIIGTTPEAGSVAPEGSYVSINIAQSRATLLTSLTQNLLVPGSTINVAGYNYTIDSLNSVSYVGNDTVAFSFTGRPYVSLLGEIIHASPQTVTGHVVWSPSNEVVSIG